MKIDRKKLFGIILFGMLILSFGFAFVGASPELDDEFSIMEDEDGIEDEEENELPASEYFKDDSEHLDIN